MKPNLLRSSNGSAAASNGLRRTGAPAFRPHLPLLGENQTDEPAISPGLRLRSLIKWLLFPGLDLLTRCRYRFLPTFFAAGPLLTLDAGCGNGALSYAAYRLGNTVVGITADPGEVRRNRQLFACRGIPSRHLSFMQLNLYDLPQLGPTFDQVICSETLEHVTQDALILRYFNARLKRGGILHLCSPFALHPLNHLGRVDEPEDGRHVRDGYTREAYAQLLNQAGFEIVASAGLGGPLAVNLERGLGWIRAHFGDVVALPLFLIVLPLTWLDTLNPRLPFSLYVKAIKRRDIGDAAAPETMEGDQA